MRPPQVILFNYHKPAAWELNVARRSCCVNCIEPNSLRSIEQRTGGGRGIRTPGDIAATVVFKTTAFVRSAIPPNKPAIDSGPACAARMRRKHCNACRRSCQIFAREKHVGKMYQRPRPRPLPARLSFTYKSPPRLSASRVRQTPPPTPSPPARRGLLSIRYPCGSSLTSPAR